MDEPRAPAHEYPSKGGKAMYIPSETRYSEMRYRRCGASGLMLPEISLGLWHNFGDITPFGVQQAILRQAFDLGITHFDLANNYGPPYGEAERNFGIHMDRDWHAHRDELVISTKAGYDMWPGPYGNFGSRKYLISSLDQSLKRMHLNYVDIFYHHRPDPETPLEETMGALDHIVRSGKALYVGISNYPADRAVEAAKILRALGTPLMIHQPRYSMLDRWVEGGLTDALRAEKVGLIAFGPLAGGVLTGKYLGGIPADSRAGHDPRYLKPESITDEKLRMVRALAEVAAARGQSLSQLALSWVLRDEVVTSALIGASKPEQVIENVAALSAPKLTSEELERIDRILAT
jgi:L-glyceraldehyde 3-phosphate reductase